MICVSFDEHNNVVIFDKNNMRNIKQTNTKTF